MRIQSLRVLRTQRDLGARFYNPKILWHRKEFVFVELTTSDGILGWGESWTFDQSSDALVCFIETEVAPKVIGRDASGIRGIQDIWEDVWAATVLTGRHGMTAAALSAVDCALWDIAGKRAGAPVATLINAASEPRAVPVYASGGLYRVNGHTEGLTHEMQGYIGDGFRAVKMKIGSLDFEDDVARVRRVRTAIGPDCQLIVDAVYSLDQQRAERWIPVWREAAVAAVQAPFAPHEWALMQWLNQDIGIPVMVFEAECRFEIFRGLLNAGAVGILQFSPIAAGGITAALKLIDLAESYDCPVSLQVSSTWLAEIIALQIAAARPSVWNVEMHSLHRFLFDHAEPKTLKIKNGCQRIGNASGLGFERPRDACFDGQQLCSEKAEVTFL